MSKLAFVYDRDPSWLLQKRIMLEKLSRVLQALKLAGNSTDADCAFCWKVWLSIGHQIFSIHVGWHA